MRVRNVAALAAALVLLCACSGGVQYVMSEYGATSSAPFAIEGEDVYKVFDKPGANKLMITPSIAKAAMIGAASGATFGAVNGDSPKPIYERAALAYLESTGRKCRIVDGYLLIKPQWEFKYDCALAPGVAVPNSRRP